MRHVNHGPSEYIKSWTYTMQSYYHDKIIKEVNQSHVSPLPAEISLQAPLLYIRSPKNPETHFNPLSSIMSPV